jgi:hypothetical protein
MRPEVETLVQLLARSLYERWKAGERTSACDPLSPLMPRPSVQPPRKPS